MFDEIEFERIKRLPKYVFAAINEIKLQMRQEGKDVIDFSMGNPDGPTPEHIIDKLCESARKPKNHGYSVSKGIYKLRLALADTYRKKYGVILDPETEVCATMGSKEGYVHLVQAITNRGDTAVVAEPAYPIHYYAFYLAGVNVSTFPLQFNERFELDVESYFDNLKRVLHDIAPKPKFVVVNFPHNPTTTVVDLNFYERLVALAREERFYIISDIAYADLVFDDYKAPSILQVPGAKDVAVECYTLSKSYNMAGWRIGFVCGNAKVVGALQKIKSWLDYGIYTPMQIAATIALNGPQECVSDIAHKYKKRSDVLVESFKSAGWEMQKPRASMFIWAKIPHKCAHLKSMEFSKELLQQANIALSPGIGFGRYGDDYVRIALIENESRIRQAGRNLKAFLKNF